VEDRRGAGAVGGEDVRSYVVKLQRPGRLDASVSVSTLPLAAKIARIWAADGEPGIAIWIESVEGDGQ
jgi:hypothetical protein